MKLNYNDINFIINEAVAFITEGGEWEKSYGYIPGKRGRVETIRLNINQDKTDKANVVGDMAADTRVFGSKNDIIHGDGTTTKHTKSLYQNLEIYKAKEIFLNNLIDFCDGKIEFDDLDFSNVPYRKSTALNYLNDKVNGKELLKAYALNQLEKIKTDYSVKQNTYDRVSSENSDNVMRYITGVVPGTNVNFIALYGINDFNFNDALKHGKVRGNIRVGEILGRENGEMENGETIPVVYDNNHTMANVEDNFSLKDVNDEHYKQQYDLGDKKSYTSIHQFLDKSIIYASNVLKKVNFIPDYIVAAPSSSNFNKYYCTNLSRKIGVEFVDDFFDRSIFEVKINGGKNIDDLKNYGFKPDEIKTFKEKIKGHAFKHITGEIRTPIVKYFYSSDFSKFLKNIITDASVTKMFKMYKDNKLIEKVVNVLVTNVYFETLEDMGENVLAQAILNKDARIMDKKYRLLRNFNFPMEIQNKIAELKTHVSTVLNKYIDILLNSEEGFKLTNARNFKITDFNKRERQFLSNCYVVADKQLSKNGEMFKKFQNAKFLLFDEDINSGGTLRMLINAIAEKRNDPFNKNVMCLCNAYSNAGN